MSALTETKLKKLIIEVINEVRIMPEPLKGTPEQIEKIHHLINSGKKDMQNMAQSLVDGLRGDPNYVEKYIEYQRVGDIEKLGTKAAAETNPYGDTMTDAFELANQRGDEMHPDLKRRKYQNFADLGRMSDTINTHTDRFFSSVEAERSKKKRRQ